MNKMTLPEIIKANKQLEQDFKEKDKVEIKILANISVNQLLPVLEYHLRSNHLNAHVTVAEYDNIIQESAAIEKKQIPVIFWELANIKDSFAFEIEGQEVSYYQHYIEKVKSELQFVFRNLSQAGIVLFNSFSHLTFSSHHLKPGLFEKFVCELSEYLEKNAPANFIIINIDKVLSNVSIDNAIDRRGAYLSKTFYTISFFKQYTSFIAPVILSIYSMTKKAIIFDCDNTLWKGVVGEDGVKGIALSEKDKNGVYFKEVHQLIKALIKQGVIIGICSKNNEADVKEVFAIRKDGLLQLNDFVIIKVNWADKPTNLRAIAKELNIGLDSIVFVDDSNFELDMVSVQVPELKTIQVPTTSYDYPALINSNLDLFFKTKMSDEDTKRAQMYRENMERVGEMKSFENIEEYLVSLEIALVLANKDEDCFDRQVQLTQKTNQFNLTTNRYTDGELREKFQSNQWHLISLEAMDKFGTSGVTGLCIIQCVNKKAVIDTLLMSCRILGRNIEKAFLREVLLYISRTTDAEEISATFARTQKNAQVENFYEENGFSLLEKTAQSKRYLFVFNQNRITTEIKYIQTSWKKN